MDLNDRLDEVISQSKNKFNIIKDSVSFLFFLIKIKKNIFFEI